jgi:predicted Zn-dependent protease
MADRGRRTERVAAAGVVAGALGVVAVGVLSGWGDAVSAAGALPARSVSDGDVLAEVPARRLDAATAERARLRRALDANPRDLQTASRLARMLIAAARAGGDPRFLGRAQAALQPWWDDARAPAEALLLRATIKQSRHDFDAALADLDQLVTTAPGDPQAWLTRAVVLGVRGRHAQGLASCARLEDLASPLVVAACRAPLLGVTGRAHSAVAALAREMRFARTPVEAAWAEGLLADLALWSGDARGAETRLRAILRRDPDDRAARVALADLYLDEGRAPEAAALAGGRDQDDGLLLRLALARAAQGADRHGDPAARAVQARFEAARLRGDTVHQREEARFLLEVVRDPARALSLAEQNWRIQKEPADARLLLEAAAAARAPDAAAPALTWLADTGCEWPRLRDLAGSLASGRATGTATGTDG